ncbi:MAG: hypothetical protein ABI806_29850, partial [Candidatus Solibacter sp.]
MMQGVGGIALAQSVEIAAGAPGPRKWPLEEGPDTPKLCLAPGDGGGPLPAALAPAGTATAAPAGGAAAGRGGRGGGGGNYGGFLAPKNEPAPVPPPAPAAGTGRGGGFGG